MNPIQKQLLTATLWPRGNLSPHVLRYRNDIEVCLYFAASILVEKLKFRSEILMYLLYMLVEHFLKDHGHAYIYILVAV